MTRNERIAERIRDTIGGGFARTVADHLVRGDYDDLLGPEVTEEALKAMPGSRDMFQEARTILDDVRRTWETWHSISARESGIDAAMRYRRLAKWMRALERSVVR